ncbi:hypothetical protein [Parasitella parasitica]|uniref:Cyclin-like domain-containing protein n=1 Tax=Parasitella parasitica TaxID=35722 RepID=A0A0B7N6F2_9FUNG|nr:hypothetical protein [Parasitella parasitica]
MSGSSPLAPNTPNTPSSVTAITTGISLKRQFKPYFTKRQLATLSSLKKSGTLAAKENIARHTYCKFIQDVGKKLGFPQKTISTSQALYHRFYLYYSIRDYAPQVEKDDCVDISVTCIFVASKIEETLKKLKDIIVAVHSVKYPDKKELDPEQLRHPYEYVVKFIKWIQAFQPTLDCKKLAKKAYSLAVDSYKTIVCIEYPAHTIAAGCIYLASLLLKDEDENFQGLSTTEPWDQHFLSRMEDIEDVSQQILDLYIAINIRGDVTHLTRIKIALNEQAQSRGPDRIMDDVTREEIKPKLSDWEFDGVSNPLDVLYKFCCFDESGATAAYLCIV